MIGALVNVEKQGNRGTHTPSCPRTVVDEEHPDEEAREDQVLEPPRVRMHALCMCGCVFHFHGRVQA